MPGSVVFVRVGWMEFYRLSATGEPAPIGGGKYTSRGIGSERDNFLPDAFGRVRGYFAIGRGDQDINLFRVDGMSRSKAISQISGVLVIFVSKPPGQEDGKGPAIVGFYKGATLYRQQQKPASDGRSFRTEALAQDARLISAEERTFRLPRATRLETGMGQSNIFYIRETDGKGKHLPWIKAAIKYVERREKASPPLGNADNVDPTTAAEIQADRRSGFTSNAQIRKAVEERAMAVVRQAYPKFTLENTSTTKPYDYTYLEGTKKRYIEVKGTQSKAPSIILTANEVAFAREHIPEMELCIVHSIEVKHGDQPRALGGTLEIIRPWSPDQHELTPLQYVCLLDRGGTK